MQHRTHSVDALHNHDLIRVEKNANITHDGNLTINGDIEENATIHVRDGSLTILGDVKEGATIIISISEKLREVDPIIYGVHFSANRTPGNTLCGNVNIGDRLYSNDDVTKLSVGHYKIKPAANILSASEIANAEVFFASLGKQIIKVESIPGLATAIIDGVTYQGEEIDVKGPDVFVDGQKVADLALQMKLKKIKEGPTLLIHGDVGHSVTIRSDAKMEIKGNVHNFCQIESSHAGLKANNIGKETRINVAGAIVVADVDTCCALTSQAKIKALSLKSEVTVQAKQGVKVREDIDDYCIIKTLGHLKASTIGHHVNISTKDDISVGYVGNHSSLITTDGNINGYEVGKNAVIEARDLVQLDKVDDAAKITAKGKIIAGTVGDLCKFVCNGSVKANQIGSKVEITARDCITIVEPMINFDGSLKCKLVKAGTIAYSMCYALGKITEAAIIEKQGVFASPKKSELEQDCTITRKKMKNPVRCKLDGKMYEKSAITDWLAKYGKSPVNRVPLGDIPIEDVLVAQDELETSYNIRK